MKRSEAVEKLAEKLLHTKLFGYDKNEQEQSRISSRMERLRIAHEAIKALEEMDLLPPNATGTNWRGKWEKE